MSVAIKGSPQAARREKATVDFLNHLAKTESRGGSLDNDAAALKAMSGRGGFNAAKSDRFSDDWVPPQTHPSALHRTDSKSMRNRARDLVMNNPLAKGGVDAYIANVLERGITPKPKDVDETRRRLWVSAWNHWSGDYDREADITGHQHLYELQALWLEEVIVAGGCLLHFVELPRRSGRRLPLALELIPEERFADDNDDFIRFQNAKKSGNPIIRGCEVEASSGRTLNYWIRPQDLTGYDQLLDPKPLPAADCQYAFLKKRIGQYRGHSWLHAAVMWLWKLGYFTDNELMASAVKSSFAAVITTEDGDGIPTLSDGDGEPSADEYLNPMEKLQPAMIARLRPGEGITGVGPNVPGSDSEAWIVFIERCIGVALGLSYEELCRDYSKGSFSSTRASANADRKRFRMVQQFAIRHFSSPVWKRFAMSSVRAGTQGFPSPAEFVGNMDEWLDVAWRAPGWASVNPLDDARAADINLNNGKTNLEEEAAADGGPDWEDRLEQRSREQTKTDDLRLRLTGSKAQMEAEASIQTAHDTAQVAKNGK